MLEVDFGVCPISDFQHLLRTFIAQMDRMLPLELLYDISNHLPAEDCLGFRMCCTIAVSYEDYQRPDPNVAKQVTYPQKYFYKKRDGSFYLKTAVIAIIED
jgi:hypothetical protein